MENGTKNDLMGENQMKKILGISGSPVKDSNTDTLVKTVLEATELDQEFVKLSEIEVAPCIACKKCVYTNKCVLDDDFKELSQMVLDADAIVIGTPVMYGNASAFIKAFVERLWSLRHIKLLTQGKIGATATVGWTMTEEVSEWMNSIMMAGGIELIGSVIGHGSPGCFTCGPGETCSYSVWNSIKKFEQMTNQSFGLDNIYEGYLEELPGNDPFENPSYKVLNCISVKDQPEKIAEAERIGKLIKEKLQ